MGRHFVAYGMIAALIAVSIYVIVTLRHRSWRRMDKRRLSREHSAHQRRMDKKAADAEGD